MNRLTDKILEGFGNANNGATIKLSAYLDPFTVSIHDEALGLRTLKVETPFRIDLNFDIEGKPKK